LLKKEIYKVETDDMAVCRELPPGTDEIGIKRGDEMRTELIKYRGNRSQAEMAKKFGVSQQTWSFWETGYSTPSAKTMYRLSKASRIPLKRLFPDIFN